MTIVLEIVGGLVAVMMMYPKSDGTQSDFYAFGGFVGILLFMLIEVFAYLARGSAQVKKNIRISQAITCSLFLMAFTSMAYRPRDPEGVVSAAAYALGQVGALALIGWTLGTIVRWLMEHADR
jgi:hypothetical protein